MPLSARLPLSRSAGYGCLTSCCWGGARFPSGPAVPAGERQDTHRLNLPPRPGYRLADVLFGDRRPGGRRRRRRVGGRKAGPGVIHRRFTERDPTNYLRPEPGKFSSRSRQSTDRSAQSGVPTYDNDAALTSHSRQQVLSQWSYVSTRRKRDPRPVLTNRTRAKSTGDEDNMTRRLRATTPPNTHRAVQ